MKSDPPLSAPLNLSLGPSLLSLACDFNGVYKFCLSLVHASLITVTLNPLVYTDGIPTTSR